MTIKKAKRGRDRVVASDTSNRRGKYSARAGANGRYYAVVARETVVADSGDTLARHWAQQGRPETPVAGQVYSDLVASAGPAAARGHARLDDRAEAVEDLL